MVWMDGPGIRAWREGARFVINEIDKASDDALSLLFAVLDDPEFAELTLPTGEVVRPTEGFHVVATMNGVPSDLPAALQDRFPVTIQVVDVNPEAIKALPSDLQVAARESALVDNEDRRLSIRMWAEFGSLRTKLDKRYRTKGKGSAVAAQAIFGARWKEALRAIDFNEYDEADKADKA
jgi:MoxR-like ATPase